MRLYRTTVAAALTFATALPAMAADNVGTLKTALGHMPEAVLATSDPMPIVYLDVKALSAAEHGALSDGGLRRLGFSRTIRPLETLMYGMGKTWTEKAGIAFDEISYFAGYGQPPARVSYWGLADAPAVTALLDTLMTRKFEEVTSTPRMLANGEPRMISILTREPDNPWLGPLGQTSFVLGLDEAVAQSSAPEDLQPIIAMNRSVADNAAIATALAGIADAPIAKDDKIVQAMVITPLFGLATIDPSDLRLAEPGDLEAAKKKIEAKMQEGTKGIPPYLAGILVDAQGKEKPALLVSLAYADCAAAEIAVATIRTRWNKAEGLSQLADVSGETVPAGDGACAALVRFAARTEVNKAMFEAYGRYLDRNFNFLQIGTPE